MVAPPKVTKAPAFKVDMKDILTSPYSELTRVNLREIFSVQAMVGLQTLYSITL
jgi:hypothetical protein